MACLQRCSPRPVGLIRRFACRGGAERSPPRPRRRRADARLRERSQRWMNRSRGSRWSRAPSRSTRVTSRSHARRRHLHPCDISLESSVTCRQTSRRSRRRTRWGTLFRAATRRGRRVASPRDSSWRCPRRGFHRHRHLRRRVLSGVRRSGTGISSTWDAPLRLCSPRPWDSCSAVRGLQARPDVS